MTDTLDLNGITEYDINQRNLNKMDTLIIWDKFPKGTKSSSQIVLKLNDYEYPKGLLRELNDISKEINEKNTTEARKAVLEKRKAELEEEKKEIESQHRDYIIEYSCFYDPIGNNPISTKTKNFYPAYVTSKINSKNYVIKGANPEYNRNKIYKITVTFIEKEDKE